MIACAAAMATPDPTSTEPEVPPSPLPAPAPEVAPTAPRAAERPSRIARWMRPGSRRRRVALAAVVYLVAIAVFAGLAGPERLAEHTQYNHYALLADAWLHGRQDLAKGPPAYAMNNDFAEFKGKTYISFPPFPAVLMLPFVKVAGSPENFPRRPVRPLARRRRARGAAPRPRKAQAHGSVTQDRVRERRPRPDLRLRHGLPVHGCRGHGLVRRDGRRRRGPVALRALRARRGAPAALGGDDRMRLHVASDHAVHGASVRARGVAGARGVPPVRSHAGSAGARPVARVHPVCSCEEVRGLRAPDPARLRRQLLDEPRAVRELEPLRPRPRVPHRGLEMREWSAGGSSATTTSRRTSGSR